MFSNSAVILRGIVKVLCIIGMVLMVICGIIASVFYFKQAALLGVLCIVAGIVAAALVWVSCLMTLAVLDAMCDIREIRKKVCDTTAE